jgi:hypothetical protein
MRSTEGGVAIEETGSLREFRKAVWIYHVFPSLIAVVVLLLFLASFFLSANYLVSAVTASVPALLLLWRWSAAGRLIDKCGCPQCGKSLKGKLAWTYPPAKCPHCGTVIGDMIESPK